MAQHATKFDSKRLRAARGERSPEEVAVVARVSRQTINRWENGFGEPDASQLAAIARLTGRSLNFFFTPLRAVING